MPHAASGRLQLAAQDAADAELGVSMPHAADGRLQRVNAEVMGKKVVSFQRRTRQVIGCNNSSKVQEVVNHQFQCRTRQVVGCNLPIWI